MSTQAWQTMQRINPNVLYGRENGHEVFIEDVRDPDGRMYRVEYRCDSNGNNTEAYLLYNPWGANTYGVNESHLFSDGRICLGPHGQRFTLEAAQKRVNYFATGYSVLRETGRFPNL